MISKVKWKYILNFKSNHELSKPKDHYEAIILNINLKD